jgi:Thrombospondin type 3 repeat
LQLSLRPARWAVVSGSASYRRVLETGGESLSGVGDFEFAASWRLYSRPGWRLGGWSVLRLPVGDEDQGLSTGQVEGEYGLSGAVTLFRDALEPRLDWTWNIGYRNNKNETFGYGIGSGPPSTTGVFFPSYPAVDGDASRKDNDQLLLRSTLAFSQRWAHIFLDFSAAYFAFDDNISTKEGEAWVTPGVYLGKEDGPALKASWSIGLNSDDVGTSFEPKLPDWFVELGVSMPIFLGGRDRDDDGIPDREDNCPLLAEDLDGFRDEDGCPDPDNDGDGVEDRLDLAPNLPEDFDGFEDRDGRPDLDNDLDGIPDLLDRCPLQPEDFDGVEDEDGCPDVILDQDEDGVEDAQDSCPFEPEDVDGFEDDDGCPEYDNDLDGIEDSRDACPDEAEDYDGFEDDDGCPEDGPASSS